MVSLKQKSGFTIVELLIVIVIIGILAGLVITTFVGIQQRARNSERQTDINSVSSQLEGYFAKNSGYPALEDLSTGVDAATWREANEIKMGDDDKAMADPSLPDSALVAEVPDAVGEAYSYVPLPVGCVSPTDETGASVAGNFCTSYTLTAFMEGNTEPYRKLSAN